ncbi:hypothetical protein FRC10_005889 [Ceratobasidium sp. 414]|nr:hypothetical protein FRC10_005889 [Ceratobasidium sp. 414]
MLYDVRQIIRNGLTRPDALAATRAFLLPVCGLALAVAMPALGLRLLGGPQRWDADALWRSVGVVGVDNGADASAVTVVYPGIFCATAAVGLVRAGRRAGRRWLQGVRDDEFLVELRLRNLEGRK